MSVALQRHSLLAKTCSDSKSRVSKVKNSRDIFALFLLYFRRSQSPRSLQALGKFAISFASDLEIINAEPPEPSVSMERFFTISDKRWSHLNLLCLPIEKITTLKNSTDKAELAQVGYIFPAHISALASKMGQIKKVKTYCHAN